MNNQPHPISSLALSCKIEVTHKHLCSRINELLQDSLFRDEFRRINKARGSYYYIMSISGALILVNRLKKTQKTQAYIQHLNEEIDLLISEDTSKQNISQQQPVHQKPSFQLSNPYHETSTISVHPSQMLIFNRPKTQPKNDTYTIPVLPPQVSSKIQDTKLNNQAMKLLLEDIGEFKHKRIFEVFNNKWFGGKRKIKYNFDNLNTRTEITYELNRLYRVLSCFSLNPRDDERLNRCVVEYLYLEKFFNFSRAKN